MTRKKDKDTVIDGSPHQLCCPKCKGTEFTHFIRNIPIAPFIPEYGLAHFLPYQWEVCTKCGWSTGTPPEYIGRNAFRKLVEWSKSMQLEGLRRMSFGYKPTQLDIDNSFQYVEDQKTNNKKLKITAPIGSVPDTDPELERMLAKLPKNASFFDRYEVIDEWERKALKKFRKMEQTAKSYPINHTELNHRE